MNNVGVVRPIFYVLEAGLSFVGAGIAGTLWWAHRQNIDLPCTSGGGCDVVAESRWAHISIGPWHAIPVALLGFLTYLVLLALALMKLGAEQPRTVRLLHIPFLLIATVGLLFSLFLQWVAHFKLGAFCVWCFSSATTMLLIFLTAVWEQRHYQRFAADVRQQPTGQPLDA